MSLAVPILVSLLVQPPPVPDPPSPSDADLAEIERSLANDAAARAAAPAATPPAPAPPPTSNPALAVILDASAAAFSSREPRQDGGHDPAKNGFTLQQLELSLGSAVDPYFRFDAFIVLSPFGIEIEEAFATTLALPASLQARAGQFLTRFGRHNPSHPHAWEFVDQPFVMSRMFGGEGNRGLGAELSWLLPLPYYAELFGSVTDAAGAATAASFYGGEDLGVHGLRDFQYTLGLKQFFAASDALSILWGLSGAFGPNPTGYHNRSAIYGTDLYLKYRPLTAASSTVVSLQAEALARRRQIPHDTLADHGGYAQLFYRFARRWGAGARFEYGSPVRDRAGARATDYLDPLWDGHRQRATLALTFWPSEFSRLRLQASRDMTSGDEPEINAVMLALEVLAGAHGAHAF